MLLLYTSGLLFLLIQLTKRVILYCVINNAFDSNGSIISKYDKIHMFDVILRNNEIYKESDTFKSGNKLETFDINGWNKPLSAYCFNLLMSTVRTKSAGLASPSACNLWARPLEAKTTLVFIFVLLVNSLRKGSIKYGCLCE